MSAITSLGQISISMPEEEPTSESPAIALRRVAVLSSDEGSDSSEVSESSDSDDEVMPVRAAALTDRQVKFIVMGINLTCALIIFSIWYAIVDRSGI